MKAQFNYRGIDLVVGFDYEPAEAQTHYYPGCGESFSIWSVTHKGEDISELLQEYFEDFETDFINFLKNRRND